MIDGASVLGVITARGGSKGLPRKNVLPLAGKPMIAWTVEAGLASACIDRLVLSTDDEEIAEAARTAGCEVPFMRPDELAADDTPGIAPVIHAIDAVPGFDYVVLLQPTSPLRTAADIDACVDLCASSGAPSCVSVVEARENPYWMYTLSEDASLDPLIASELVLRRQELPPAYSLNGAVYVARCEWLRRRRHFVDEGTVGHVMPPERSFEIDGPLDFVVVRAVMNERMEGRL